MAGCRDGREGVGRGGEEAKRRSGVTQDVAGAGERRTHAEQHRRNEHTQYVIITARWAAMVMAATIGHGLPLQTNGWPWPGAATGRAPSQPKPGLLHTHIAPRTGGAWATP